MGITSSARWATAALAAGVVGLCLLVAGCTTGEERVSPRPPILDVLERKQEFYDQLPPGSPALLTVVPSSSRSMGGIGMHEFFLARGLMAPYCIVAIDIYGVQVGQVCGGDSFSGELTEGVHFAFGGFYAGAVPRVRSLMQFSPQFAVGFVVSESVTYPAVNEILARAQQPTDIPPGADSEGGWAEPEAYRLLALDGTLAYYIARTTWVGRDICVFAYEQQGDVGWGSGSCGSKDVVLYTPEGQLVHFSAVGFEGETPAGWRQVSELLRVKDADAAAGELFRIGDEEAQPLRP